MSISDEIENRCNEQRLFSVEPADLRPIRQSDYRRFIYASSDIHHTLDSENQNDAFTRRRLQQVFGNFILGRTIAVALKLERHQGADLARLVPSGEEMWEVRVQGRRRPDIPRVLGRFAKTDVFIALRLFDHAELRGRKNSKIAMARCQMDWDELFRPYSAHSGRTVYDYVSAKVHSI
jgi:hypothetical protein